MGIWGNAPQITVMNFGTLGLNYYAFAKAAWNCELDVDELMADYCRHYYGPGGAQALHFYEELELATAAAGKTGCPLEAFEWSVPHVLTRSTRERLRASVQGAEIAVAHAALNFRHRVRELSLVMEYVERYCASLDKIEATKTASESADPIRAAKHLDEAEKTGLDAFAFAHQHRKDRIFAMQEPDLNQNQPMKRWHRNIVHARAKLSDKG